jgi:tetratricopeptide (TPR) repeat protein
VIFDLKSGKRRRVVQVVFGILAFIFFISFVGFGIGSNATGGIFDALGLSGDDSSSTPQYDQQIEDAQSTLQTDPKNQAALVNLVRYNVLAARGGISSDQASGTIEISEDARSQLEDAAAAWRRYLKTDPKAPNLSAAVYAAEAYRNLGDPAGAAGAQRVVAAKQNTAAAYNQLAIYLYSDGKIVAGDAAGDKAVQAADPTQRAQVKKSMEQLAELGRKFKKQQAKQNKGAAASAEQGLENPFGGLGGTAGGTAPSAP